MAQFPDFLFLLILLGHLLAGNHPQGFSARCSGQDADGAFQARVAGLGSKLRIEWTRGSDSLTLIYRPDLKAYAMRAGSGEWRMEPSEGGDMFTGCAVLARQKKLKGKATLDKRECQLYECPEGIQLWLAGDPLRAERDATRVDVVKVDGVPPPESQFSLPR
ncbi:MAG: hypothetical protein AB1758_28435 [Candidatus Eremiobacterota bacterium]